MKCTCEECDGRGTIECPECNSSGGTEVSIEFIVLNKDAKNYDELLGLQNDAIRVKSDAEKLCKINPSRRKSYLEQLKGCLRVINEKAQKMVKKNYDCRRTY